MNRSVVVVVVSVVLAAVAVLGSIGLLQGQGEQDRIGRLTVRLKAAVVQINAAVVQINESRLEGCEQINAYKSGLAAVVGTPTAAELAAKTPKQRDQFLRFEELSKPTDCNALVNGGKR